MDLAISAVEISAATLALNTLIAVNKGTSASAKRCSNRMDRALKRLRAPGSPPLLVGSPAQVRVAEAMDTLTLACHACGKCSGR
jgi:RNase P subunit RPR2